jgi:hypothetical protein
MKIQYVAFDGTVFTQQVECEIYEDTHMPSYVAFDIMGNVVKSTLEARYVYFLSRNGVSDFIARGGLEEDERLDGFVNGDLGFYYYDADDEEYRPISTGTVRALAAADKYITNTFGE